MSEQQQQLFRARIARLARLLELRAPSGVMVMGVSLIVRSAMVLYGERMAQEFAGLFMRQARVEAGLCTFCGEAPNVEEKGMCETCWQLANAEDSDLDAMESEGKLGRGNDQG